MHPLPRWNIVIRDTHKGHSSWGPGYVSIPLISPTLGGNQRVVDLSKRKPRFSCHARWCGVAVFLEQTDTAPDISSVAIHSVKTKGLESHRGTLPPPLSLTVSVAVPHRILVGMSVLVHEAEHFHVPVGHWGFLCDAVPVQSTLLLFSWTF
ncbi:hypothetical protein HJG60_011808 [Phyllostomus discolor]|uniref:Uncharacterized protein n=1 Tax=Phyllostomus discolor TaxID=89673 RepID=A0A833ZE26_9CHIR|nr:hypothetical protein HJG60_011808 [Phyllostomus discolor]